MTGHNKVFKSPLTFLALSSDTVCTSKSTVCSSQSFCHVGAFLQSPYLDVYSFICSIYVFLFMVPANISIHSCGHSFYRVGSTFRVDVTSSIYLRGHTLTCIYLFMILFIIMQTKYIVNTPKKILIHWQTHQIGYVLFVYHKHKLR